MTTNEVKVRYGRKIYTAVQTGTNSVTGEPAWKVVDNHGSYVETVFAGWVEMFKVED